MNNFYFQNNKKFLKIIKIFIKKIKKIIELGETNHAKFSLVIERKYLRLRINFCWEGDEILDPIRIFISNYSISIW